MSMRRAASCCQPLQLISVPRGARTGRGPAVVSVLTMPTSLRGGLSEKGGGTPGLRPRSLPAACASPAGASTRPAVCPESWTRFPSGIRERAAMLESPRAGIGRSRRLRREATTKGGAMPRLIVRTFSISIDGFGAGPDQDLDHPLGVGGEELHRLVPAHAHVAEPCTAQRRRRDGRGRASSRPRGFERLRRLDPGPEHVRARPRSLARRELARLVGRGAAVPRAGLRADASRPRAAGHAGRHRVPLRHRRHRGGARAGARPRPATTTCASAAAWRPSGSTCARGWSTSCTSPSRRCCRARLRRASCGRRRRRSSSRRSSTSDPPWAGRTRLRRHGHGEATPRPARQSRGRRSRVGTRRQ